MPSEMSMSVRQAKKPRRGASRHTNYTNCVPFDVSRTSNPIALS